MIKWVKSYFNHLESKYQRIFLFAFATFIINITYGLGNAIIGIWTKSEWFLTVSAYYVILSIMRFSLMLSEKRNKSENIENEIFVKRFSGAMLFCLSLILIWTVIITVKNDVGTKYHEIIMITIATYTFTKLVFAIINLCKCKKISSPIIKALRNISVADASVSIFSLQRSMLMSFGGMEINQIRIFNILTGVGVCIVVLVLGINLLRKEKREMAKSKLVEGNEKIIEGVTTGYKKIEDTVVGTYKKIENTVVNGYEKVEDAFVDKYLTRDGETVEEAKKKTEDEKINSVMPLGKEWHLLYVEIFCFKT